MTTKKVVADGKSDAEVRGLVQVKTNEIVRRVIEGTLKLEWVLDRMQKGIIEGPSGWEEMIHIPLEWSPDFGQIAYNWIPTIIEKHCHENGLGWRLPTENELARALRAMKPSSFSKMIYYWSSTPHFDARGLTIVYNHGEGLGSSGEWDMSRAGQRHPHLCLCREKKLD